MKLTISNQTCCQNHVVEVPTSSSKKWMKNKKKSGGKKSKKKGPAVKGGAPVKKPNVANNVPNTATSTSSLASLSADTVERKDTRPAGQPASPADSVTTYILYLT